GTMVTSSLRHLRSATEERPHPLGAHCSGPADGDYSCGASPWVSLSRRLPRREGGVGRSPGPKAPGRSPAPPGPRPASLGGRRARVLRANRGRWRSESSSVRHAGSAGHAASRRVRGPAWEKVVQTGPMEKLHSMFVGPSAIWIARAVEENPYPPPCVHGVHVVWMLSRRTFQAAGGAARDLVRNSRSDRTAQSPRA